MKNKNQTIKEQRKKYYEENRDKINKNRREHYNIPEIKSMAKLIRDKPENKIKQKEYCERQEVKERTKKVRKIYRENNKEKIKDRKRKWNQDNKDIIREQHKEYYERNREKRREQIRKYIKKRYEENKNFRMTTTLRNRFTKAIKLYSKTGKIMKSKDYGIKYKKIIEHLKPFPKDIKKYEVDHIIPVSWFNLNNPKEIEWAFAPENHQWLLTTDNRKKSNNFMGGVEK